IVENTLKDIITAKKDALIEETTVSPGAVTTGEIAIGLRQALRLGLEKQVSKLAGTDGFFRNERVRITLPETLCKLDSTLRNIGLGKSVDEGIRLLNRTAERTVREAVPVLEDAVNGIAFIDANAVLLGNDNAATEYMRKVTKDNLYNKLYPIVKSLLAETGAAGVWKNIIDRCNDLPASIFPDVNPDLTGYVTHETLNGIYVMIAVEESAIRRYKDFRTTAVLRRVFALQD
ncbi:MAG: DUF4197 domain-containing protein, partial [Sinomicrobium sp.]|nr:DUF4197 domain-containing protein [Sinomicrobium sp.]